jgi:hypothetical protein
MAVKSKEEVEVTLESSQYMREIKKVDQANDDAFGKGAQEKTESFTGAILKANIALGAMNKIAGLVVNSISASIEAAKEYERTTLQLETALRGVGAATPDVINGMQSMFSQLEHVSGISDEVHRGLGAMAINLGVAAENVEPLLKAAVRLNNATGGRMGLESSMRNLIKSLSGMKGELGEALPIVREMTAEQLQQGDLINILNDRYAENIDLMNQGMTGAVNDLSNAWANFGEAMVLAATGMDDVNRAVEDMIGGVTSLLNVSASFVSEGGFGGFLGSIALAAEAVLGTEFFDEEALYRLSGQQAKRLGKAPGAQFAPGASGAPAPGRRPRGRRGKAGVAPGTIDFAGLPINSVDVFGEGDTFDFAGREGVGGEEGQTMLDAMTAREDRIDDFIEQRHQSRLEALELHEKERLRIVEEAAAMEEALRQRSADIITNTMTGMANTLVSAAIAAAEGQSVQLDRLLKDFLKGQGQQLIAQGITHAFTGAARLALSYGADASGYQLLALGGLETGAGAAMIAGSLAIQAPPRGASGGGSASAAGAGGSFSGGSDVAGLGETVNQTFQFNVVGDLSEADVIRISRGIRRHSRKGTSA